MTGPLFLAALMFSASAWAWGITARRRLRNDAPRDLVMKRKVERLGMFLFIALAIGCGAAALISLVGAAH